MAPSEWKQVVELFHAALEKSGDQRVVLLDQACGTQTLLRKAVEELLQEYESAGSFLSKPILETSPGVSCPDVVAPNQRFERFVLLEMLGRGGMGEVWSARDTELDRSVALKFLRSEMASELDTAHIGREAKAASALNHPNIVTIHEVIRSASFAAIVMELVQGSSLAKLRGTSLRNDEVLSIGGQIAKALAAAHANGIIHGDIKPENIMLREDGYVKVLDFGLARRVAIEPIKGAQDSVFGTLRYMSPEQARGESLTPASDVFSFGLVLYELASGRRAFADESPLDALRARLTRDPPAPASVNPRVPPALNSLVLAMLAKDAALRPTSAQVARQIDGMQSPRAARRRFRLASLAASLVALTLAGWFVLRSRDSPQFANLRIRPLTSQTGWEGDPAFSADGKSIAFTWGSRPDNPEIYVKPLDGGQAIKLTDSMVGNPGDPVWSPDARRIAFKREVPGLGGAIYTIPANGGPESSVINLANANYTSSIDWSPDGDKLAFSDQPPGSPQLALYLFNLRTGAKIKLTSPPTGIWGDWSPKFSPDGKTIAFKRVTEYWADEIYLVPAGGGAARKMTSIGAGIWGHAWTASGDSLIISCQRGGTTLGIWRFRLADPSRPERIQQGASDLITPAIARKTNRIAWVNRVWDTNIYRASVSGSEPPVRLIASTERDQNPAVARDGRIAFVSDRSGSREIWMSTSDGGNQTKITDFGGPHIDDLMWSPDGRRLAFDSRRHGQVAVFTIECPPEASRCREPEMLIPGGFQPAWSADGTAIFYSSSRAGSRGVWRHPLDGDPDTEVTRSGAYFLRQSRDGKWLYVSASSNETIYRMPALSGATAMGAPMERAIDGRIRALPGGWDIGPTELLFFEMTKEARPWAILALSIASGTVRFVSECGYSYGGAEGMALSVSPDGRWVYYSRLDSAGANIIIAENR